DASVIWSIQEGTSGGTIDASGFYAAPQTSGSYHVVVTSHADPSKSAMAAVNVTASQVHVTISPANVAIPSNVAWRFTTSVSGASDTSVTWSVSEGSAGGTIDSR